MPTRERAVRLLAAGLVGGAVSCAAVLGIDDKPLRPDDAGVDGGAFVDAGDAGDAGCDASEAMGCATCLAHDFCDDFDQPGQRPTDRWELTQGGPFTKEDAGVELSDAESVSSPTSLRAFATSTVKSAYVLLGHEVAFAARSPGTPFKGLRYAFDLKLSDLTFQSADGGALPDDAGAMGVAAFFDVDTAPLPKTTGIGILVRRDGVLLAVSDDIRGGQGTTDTIVLLPAASVAVLRNWLRFELVIATPAEAVLQGYEACKGIAAPLVVAGSLVKRNVGKCMAIRETILGAPDGGTWVERSAGLSLGLTLFDQPGIGGGHGAAHYDNVVLDVWR